MVEEEEERGCDTPVGASTVVERVFTLDCRMRNAVVDSPSVT